MSDPIDKKIGVTQFLKDDFKASKYFPINEDLEAKSEEVKQAWKEIWGFAYESNRCGRRYEKSDIYKQYELYAGVIPDLDQTKIEAVFKKVYDNHKDEFNIVSKPDIVKVEVWMKKQWDFIQNEITQTVEFKDKSARKYREVSIDTIYRKLQHVGFRFGLDKLKSLLKSDFVQVYNPFVDYFDKLEPWDGVMDHIGELSKYIKVSDQDFFETQFKKTLVRCIGCSLYGQENRIVFTLVGEKQSTGKSTFIRFLNPFGKDYYTEAPIRNNKDSEFAFSENFIYNLEELASLSNMDINRLKSIISLATIKERKAYAVNATQQPRRCNFFASTNKDEFLTDTQNTRWLCFDIISINWGYKSVVDIKKVWAQAFALYNDQNFNAQLTAEEAEHRDAKNKSYEINDLEKELIKRCFAVTWDHEGAFYSNADILAILQEGSKSQLKSIYISKNMKQLGFKPDVKKINGHTTRGWWAKYVAPTPGESSNYTNDDDAGRIF